MKKRKSVSYAKYGYIFSLPFVIAFCLFTLYPVFFTVIIGFTDFKGLTASLSTMHFLENPFDNYIAILHNATFLTALKNTFVIWIMNFIPQILLALILAAWFSGSLFHVKGQGFFKVVFYMPNIITAATVAILFASLFGYPMGPVNDLLKSLHIIDGSYEFLRNKWIAKGVVAFIQFWMWYGYTMIVLISGILGMSPEWFEAADIDGASGLQKFFYITMPNLRSILLYTLVTSLIGGLQMFDIPKLLVANSGPDNATLTANVFIQNQAFSGSYMYNRASAASMIMFAIICVLSAVVFFLMQDRYDVAEKKLLKKVAREEKRAARRKKS